MSAGQKKPLLLFGHVPPVKILPSMGLVLLRRGIMKKAGIILTVGLIGASVMAQESPKPELSPGSGKLQTEVSQDKTLIMAAPLSAAKVTDFNRASKILKMPVQDSAGKPLGTVKDLVFDLNKGELGYAVISLNTSGSTNRIVPVPLTALKPAGGTNANALVLNMSTSVLAAAPSVANDEWPEVDAFAVGGPAPAETGSGSSQQSSEKAK
jgi:hypothetical protein